MGRHVTRIMHKGKQVIFLDGSGLSEEEGLGAWEDMNQELLKERSGSLIMIHARDVTMTTATVNKAKEAATIIKGIPGNRIAFVGLSGLQKSTAQLVAKGAGLNAHFSADVEEAKDWLVKEDEGTRKR